MHPILKRQLERRKYVNPPVLMHTVQDADGNVTEEYQAGLLALMVQRMSGPGAIVRVSFGEIEDADAAIMLAPKAGEIPVYTLVQLKEMHPQDNRTVQEFLDDQKKKYPTSRDLIVAILVNQTVAIEYSTLNIEGFGIEQLYFFGGDREKQVIYGAPLSHWRAGIVFWGRYNWESGHFDYGKCLLRTT